MKLLVGRILAIQFAFLLFLSNTGLVYYINTCIHSGMTQLSFIASDKDDDCMMETQDDACCSEKTMSCCKTTVEKIKHGCEKSTINYVKINLETLQPDNNVLPDLSWSISPVLLPVFDLHLVINGWTDKDDFLYKLDDPPPQLSPTGLSHRILLGSFLC